MSSIHTVLTLALFLDKKKLKIKRNLHSTEPYVSFLILQNFLVIRTFHFLDVKMKEE